MWLDGSCGTNARQYTMTCHVHPFAWLLIWRLSLRYIQWQISLQIRKARSIYLPWMGRWVVYISHNFTLFLAASEHFLHQLVVGGCQLSLFSAFHSPKFAASPILITSESLTDTGSTRAIKTWWVADGISRSFGSTAMQCKEYTVENDRESERQDWQDLTCKGVSRCSFSSSMFNFRGIHTVEHEFETREEDEPRMEKTC